MQTVGLKTDLDWFLTGRQVLHGGFSISRMQLLPFYFQGVLAEADPNLVQVLTSGKLSAPVGARQEVGGSGAAYVEQDWYTADAGWHVRTGLRAESFQSQSKTRFYLLPRLFVAKSWAGRWHWNVSLGGFMQPLHMVSPNLPGSSTDLWLLSTDGIAPQYSWQASTRLLWQQPPGWQWGLEVFLKKTTHVVAYLPAAVRPPGSTVYVNGYRHWQQEVAQGTATAAGIAFTASKTLSNTKFWLNYTLSRAEHQFGQLNGGKAFAARFDHLHRFKMAATRRFNAHWSASVAWMLASGEAISTYRITEPYVGRSNLLLGGVAAEQIGFGDLRQPWQHRLDVSATWEWNRHHLRHSISAGLYNLYNQQNQYLTFMQVSPLPNGTLPLRMQSMKGLPLLPSLQWALRF